MTILNDLSKKITEVGSGALSKTKDLADVAKYSCIIAEEQKKINDTYSEIGKLYVENHMEDYEAIFEGQMASILGSQNKIDEYTAKIKEIKNEIVCTGCGEKVSKESNYCPNCGAKMPKDENNEPKEAKEDVNVAVETVDETIEAVDEVKEDVNEIKED